MLGVGANLIKSAYSRGLAYVRDGLKLYMPFRGGHSDEVQFVGTGSTSFDGTNDYVSITDANNLSFGDSDDDSALSISAWINMNDATSFPILGKGVYNTSAEYSLRLDSSDYLYLLLYDEDVPSTIEDAKVTAVMTGYEGSWIHVAATYDGRGGTSANDGILIYVNGVSQALTRGGAGTYDSMVNNSANVHIGNWESDYADGSMKNIAIWSRALTATEVQNVMYKTYDEVGGRLANGLVSWWALDAISSLGSELWDADASVFTSGIYSWNAEGNNTIANVGNALTITYVDNASGARVDLSDAEDLSANLTATKVYQLTFDASYSGGSSGVRLRVYDNSAYNYGDILTTSTASYSISFEAGHATGCFILLDNLGASNVVTIDNLSLKEVQAKDLKGSNDGTIVGTIIDTDLYGGDTPVKPRAIDNAPTVQADAIGAGSAFFDGDNDFIDVTGTFPDDDFTITAWFKTTDYDQTQGIVSWGDSANYKKRAMAIHDGGDGGGDWRLCVSVHNENAQGATTVTEGKWHHGAIVVNKGDKEYKIFLDGVLDGSGNLTNNLIAFTSEDLYIGKTPTSAFFEGNIAQVGVWTKELSQAQVQSVMEKTYDELNTDDKTSLVSYWPLDVDATDSHGSNNGTLT